MKMGRERGILRWDIRASLQTERIGKLQAEINALVRSAPSTKPGAAERLAQLTSDLHEARARLDALGPSPRAKMG